MKGNFNDLTKQKYGRLTVIDYIGRNKNRESLWLCECDCGNKIVVPSPCLKNGNTKSCGCLHKEITRELGKSFKKYNTYDLSIDYGIGHTFKNEPFYFDLEDYNKIKDYCWYKDDNGYIISSLEDNSIVFMHRLVMNCPDGMEVDHKYHDEWDNRKEFLRIVTHSQNLMNQKLNIRNTSGEKGVYWNKEKEKWQAQIGINNKVINLGRYNDFNEAVEARKQAEIEYFGEYRYKNIDSSEKNFK